jgi:hypothetical protein
MPFLFLFLLVDVVAQGATCRDFHDGEENFLMYSNAVVGKILSQKKVAAGDPIGPRRETKFDPLITKVEFKVKVSETLKGKPRKIFHWEQDFFMDEYPANSVGKTFVFFGNGDALLFGFCIYAPEANREVIEQQRNFAKSYLNTTYYGYLSGENKTNSVCKKFSGVDLAIAIERGCESYRKHFLCSGHTSKYELFRSLDSCVAFKIQPKV